MSATSQTHAVQMERYGPPYVLRYVSVPVGPLGQGEVRIRTLFAAVNHTDLEIRSGAWPLRPANPFPYIPGVEVLGQLEELGEGVNGWARGDLVITMMQGLGGVRAARPGGYAEHVTVDASAIAAAPADVNPAHLAALGLAGVTAYEGLRRIGRLNGRQVVVTGAAGGVGSAAVAIAADQGAEVVAMVSRREQIDYVLGLGASEVVVIAKGDPAVLPASSVDAVLDTVAGQLFPGLIGALRDGGVLSLVGAVGGGDVTFDAWNLIRPVTVTGYSSESLTGQDLRTAIAALGDGLRRASIRPPRFDVVPLQEAAEAHRRLAAGGTTGRLLLQPAGSSI